MTTTPGMRRGPSSHRTCLRGPMTKSQRICEVAGCEKPAHGRMCHMHYMRTVRDGTPGEAGQRHASPYEGRVPNVDGYIVLTRPGHPLADYLGRVYEHRYVAWEAGWFTDRELEVHHVDGDKGNNAPENLRVMSRSAHRTEHRLHDGCSVTECDRPHYGLGFCNMHYQRQRRERGQ